MHTPSLEFDFDAPSHVPHVPAFIALPRDVYTPIPKRDAQ